MEKTQKNPEQPNDGLTPQQRREQRREKKLNDKLERARRDDTGVISRRAGETNDFIRLINSNDFFTDQIRDQMGRTPDIPFEAALKLLERNEEIRVLINNLNFDMAKLLGRDYKSPERYEDTLKKHVAGLKAAAKTAKQSAQKSEADEETPTESTPAAQAA